MDGCKKKRVQVFVILGFALAPQQTVNPVIYVFFKTSFVWMARLLKYKAVHFVGVVMCDTYGH